MIEAVNENKAMGTPRFGVLIDVVLYKLYVETVSGDSSWFDHGDIGKLFDGSASKGYVAKCLDALAGKQLVEASVGGYSITEDGILYVEKHLEDRESVVFNYKNHGDPWLEKQSVGPRDEDEPANSSVIDLQEDEWQPLPIDRESPDYEEAIGTLDEAIGVVAGNNGYAESEPDERDNIVEMLRQGQTAITERQPSRAQIIALVLQPLNFLARKFSESAIGEIAKIAAVKIVAWLASLI